MQIPVTDARSNPSDQIAHAVRVLGRSKDRLAVFQAIYRGKRQVKTVRQIQRVTRLSRIRILQEGKKLAANGIVDQSKIDGETGYGKDAFYSVNKLRILGLLRNPTAFRKYPTKITPRSEAKAAGTVVIRIPGRQIRAGQITIDEIDSFSRVLHIPRTIEPAPRAAETTIKNGIRKLLDESGKFQDWGGESNDMFTTRLKIRGRRIPTAFALKGKSCKGRLTPRAMGKNADQIQRLFRTPAEVFIVQSLGQIDESIIEQMSTAAKVKSYSEGGKQIYYCAIDGSDTVRLMKAYPRKFGVGGGRRSPSLRQDLS